MIAFLLFLTSMDPEKVKVSLKTAPQVVKVVTQSALDTQVSKASFSLTAFLKLKAASQQMSSPVILSGKDRSQAIMVKDPLTKPCFFPGH